MLFVLPDGTPCGLSVMTDFPCRSTVTITDNDTVGVRVDPTELTVTEEDPGSGMYTVVLESQPTDTVTVTVGGGRRIPT